MKVMISLVCFLSLLLPVQGEEAQDSKKHLRVLCLGEPPPWKEDIKNGVRIQLPPPPGSLPPSQVVLSHEGSSVVLSTRLNSLTRPVSYPRKSEKIIFMEGKRAEGKKWFEKKSPVSQHGLLVLWGGKNGKKWLAPEGKVLVDDRETFPAGRIRLVNFSDLAVKAKIGESRETLTIGPGKALIREVKIGENDLQMEAKDARGKRFRIFRNVFQAKSGERVNAFIYKADGIKPRRPLKLFLRSEVARNYRAEKTKASR